MNYVGKRFFYSQSAFFFYLTQKIGVYLFQERKKAVISKERKQIEETKSVSKERKEAKTKPYLNFWPFFSIIFFFSMLKKESKEKNM